MRRIRRSRFAAFGVGLLWAGAGAGAFFGVHHLMAPPSPETALLPAELPVTPGTVSRWAQPLPEALPQGAQTSADGQTSELELRQAQIRVARQQADVEAQRALVRNIQAELQRVGCYAGSIDGAWSESTRSAMAAFNQSMNIRLPVNAPDYILLTMLHGHVAAACAPGTAPGEKRAVAKREAPGSNGSWSTTVVGSPAPVSPPVQPTQSANAPAAPPAQVGAPAVRPTAPAVAAGEMRTTQGTQAIALPEPLTPAPALPGRMAVGAPDPARIEPPALAALPSVAPAEPNAQAQVKPNGANGNGSSKASSPPPRRNAGNGGGGGGGGSSSTSSGAFAHLSRNAP